MILAAAAALIVANSGGADSYFALLATYVGPLNVLHWINDLLMALVLPAGRAGDQTRVPRRAAVHAARGAVLPGLAALGGMVAPALIYLAINSDGGALRGWAVPVATDIAFALGVLALLGRRVPVSLRIFLTALAIIDDLLAVAIIALFYTDRALAALARGGRW